jgi:isoleucyl-tRNA synthetase
MAEENSNKKSQPSLKATAGKTKIAEREEEILKFWQENKIFEKSLEKHSPKGEFVFYDGPVTSNSKPVFHTMEPFSFKDIIPRYKTMRGFHVRRKGGWDTHGLPVELQVEKKLGFKSKKDIENYGIAAFNKLCKDSVWEYIELWKNFTARMGYWADQEHAYVTYENYYIEAVWNILKKVNERKLLYKDYKVVPWCPRCGTGLSSHELAQGYEDVKDLSVTIKFKLSPDQKFGEKGEFKTGESAYILAWTTTPWTLPGNVALAIKNDISYSAVRIDGVKELLILATDLIPKVLDGHEIEKVHEFKGNGLLGLEYEPLYPYLSNNLTESEKEKLAKAFKVYNADFVTTEDGTGVVHTAVMYGQDDFVLGNEIGLPKVHLVNDDGTFKADMDFMSGRFVKEEDEKGRPTLAIEIIEDLKKKGFFFHSEPYKHSYPFCWRCHTPLIYYARDSWYIKMSSLRETLVKENESINWIPSHIKEGRFGEWLREIKDWAISRERYWGTPLPIWQNEDGQNYCLGSINELKERTQKSDNKYFMLRHAEAEQNLKGLINANIKNVFHLTKEGEAQASATVKILTDEKINLIVSSPFQRCQETAEIVRKALGLDESQVVFDERLKEFQAGEQYEGKTWLEYAKYFGSIEERFEKAPTGGETLVDLNKRAGDFLYDLENKYADRNILIVTHEGIMTALQTVAAGSNLGEAVKIKADINTKYKYAELKALPFIPLPHNENYELDLHKPFIDEIKLTDENGRELKRVKEVMDVWFDSGGMPFAQDGLNSGNKMQYPADFISEAVDQTRGWFYTLHAIGVLMEKGKAFKNVICLGHILDSKGKKMSKSTGNIVDPWIMIDKYGVDALRMWMYTVNQPGDSKNFDEKTVDELVKKIFNPASNILSFYDLYEDRNVKPHNKSSHVLDRWIINRLNLLIKTGGESLDNFQVFEAARLIRDFIGDFSTWYIRRSRDRFKSEDIADRDNALSSTRFVLLEMAKYMAPFTPFFAENIYLKLKSETDLESVHLCDFPKIGQIDEEILKNMEEARKIVSLALEKRMTANLKVRQPLNELRIKNYELRGKEEYLELIKDEINVKNVSFNEKLETEVELDTEITAELQKEGNARDFIRAVQELRKNKNLVPADAVTLLVETDVAGRKFLEDVEKEIKKPTNVSDFVFQENDGDEININSSVGELKFKIKIK